MIHLKVCFGSSHGVIELEAEHWLLASYSAEIIPAVLEQLGCARNFGDSGDLTRLYRQLMSLIVDSRFLLEKNRHPVGIGDIYLSEPNETWVRV